MLYTFIFFLCFVRMFRFNFFSNLSLSLFSSRRHCVLTLSCFKNTRVSPQNSASRSLFAYFIQNTHTHGLNLLLPHLSVDPSEHTHTQRGQSCQACDFPILQRPRKAASHLSIQTAQSPMNSPTSHDSTPQLRHQLNQVPRRTGLPSFRFPG